MSVLTGLPGNVRVNWPTDGVSLFDLANVTDVFANGWSSAGKEMAWLGLPVVLYSDDVYAVPIRLELRRYDEGGILSADRPCRCATGGTRREYARPTGGARSSMNIRRWTFPRALRRANTAHFCGRGSLKSSGPLRPHGTETGSQGRAARLACSADIDRVFAGQLNLRWISGISGPRFRVSRGDDCPQARSAPDRSRGCTERDAGFSADTLAYKLTRFADS